MSRRQFLFLFKEELFMTKRTKLVCACAAGVTALAIVGSMGLAFFTDTDKTEAAAKAGSVKINVSDLEIENADNVNPGDEDIDIPDGSREGTSHDFTFTVTNSGNKSVVTRNIITLTIKKDGDVLDAGVLALYENRKELAKKYVQLDGSTDFIPIEDYNNGKIVAVRYIVTGASLNGTGDAAEIEEGIKSTKQDYHYDLSLAYEATNGYQLADIKADIEVQAMQYRNTKDSTWETVFTDTKTATTSA